MKFDGTGDCLVVSSSSTDYGYGTGDFTIELWVYFNSLTRQTVLSNLTSDSKHESASLPIGNRLEDKILYRRC